jgi:exodeoxyribonuclease VII small subunit
VSRKKPDTLSFEQALAELEALVDAMEKGELSLEDSLKSFERGVELTRICQKALADAEQKVEILTRKSADAELEPFPSDDT